ncbi:MAG: DNA topoisomerase 3 [Clostridia bacterium]|nr:DNA topoisomerase 3 [Clostridia bacterium]
MKKLVVAEKPSVAKDIARVLGAKSRGDGFLYGDDYVVTWAIGHLVSLCEPGEVDERWQKWNMADLPMLPEDIPLKALPATKKQYEIVKKLMNSAKIDSIICATDSAREGELIFRYIYRLSGCKKRVERLWISSMTDAAIRQGFDSLKPASSYDALYESARCRSVADWLVGMNASRAFSLRYNAHLSIGRVQTPTLNLIVKRDLEIENFVPQDYWEVRANFGDYEGLWINPETKETRCPTKELAEKIKAEVNRQEAEVIESESEHKRMPPPQLFDLTTLQREANKRYGYSADKTLKIAQSLYEKHKLLTYPRTDSRYLPDDMRPKIKKALAKLPEPYAAFVSSPEMNPDMHLKRFYDNSKISDHHAIVPTEKVPVLEKLALDEKNIYDMVARRLIAAHYPAYEYESAKIITRAKGHDFKSTGSAPIRDGWKALYKNDKPEKGEILLPKLSRGEKRRVEKITTKACKTKPPQPHTDASILSMMENAGREIEDEALREQMKDSGLGTPATRASIIERLIQVGYARRSGKHLVSTEKGKKLIAVVPEQISSAATTGKWEKALSAMAGFQDAELREAKSARFLQGIDRFSIFLVDAAKNARPDVRFENEFKPKKRVVRKAKPK